MLVLRSSGVGPGGGVGGVVSRVVVVVLLLLLPGWPPVQASTSSDFTIVLPGNLNKSGLPHRLLMFDDTPTASKLITGRVRVWVRQESCGLENPSAALLGAGGDVVITLRNRECDLSLQASVLQRVSGVRMIAVVDDVCQCGTRLADNCAALADVARDSTPELLANPAATCVKHFPPVHGNDFESVRIPIVILDNTDGMNLLNAALNLNTPVIVSFRWNMPATVVTLDLWTSSESQSSMKNAFYMAAPSLDGHVEFTPHYILHDAEEWQCMAEDSDPFCEAACVNHKYCASGSMTVNGALVVAEDLRQLCIFQQSTTQLGSSAASHWWRYVSLFASACAGNFTAACSEVVQSKVPGLEAKKTADCVKRQLSGGSGNAKTNSWMLDDEIKTRLDHKISRDPTLGVNNFLLRSETSHMTVSSLLDLICQRSRKQPAVCACLGYDDSVVYGLVSCVSASSCKDGEFFCPHTAPGAITCFKTLSEYQQYCGRPSQAMCTAGGFEFCPALETCLVAATPCPVCPAPALPFYCTISSSCVSSHMDCTLSPGKNNTTGSGGKGPIIYASEVVAIAVFFMGTIGLFMHICWWRYQRIVFQDEVRRVISAQYVRMQDEGETGSRGTTDL